MKKLMVCIGAIFIILFTACARQNIQRDLNYDKVNSESNCLSDENFHSNQNNLIEKKDIYFSFSSTLNVFVFDNSKIPLENKIKINQDEVLSLTLMVNVTPDKTMPMSNIPLRIWVIVDGKPVKLSLYEFNDYCISQDTFVDASIDQFINISFPVSKQDKTITIVCNFFPELIPELGLEFSGGISYTIINENSISNLISIENDNYYLKVEKNEKNYGIDIGTKRLEQNDNMVLENHHYEDIVFYNDNEQNLYIKFNSSDTKPIPYYIFLLCDGKIIKTFDEEYTYKVNCMNGDRTFQYLIPNKLLPDSGLHTLQAFAIPAEEYDNLNSYSTKKIRIMLEN